MLAHIIGNIFRRTKRYFIPRGSHYCIHLPRFVKNKRIVFDVVFDESCKYSIGIADQSDINKLTGFSWGHIHKNSYRIGWSYDPFTTMITLYDYIYANGVRSYNPIAYVSIGEKTRIEMEILYGYPRTIINEGRAYVRPQNRPIMKYKPVLCFPYFGGNTPAPHDITIKIKWLVR